MDTEVLALTFRWHLAVLLYHWLHKPIKKLYCRHKRYFWQICLSLICDQPPLYHTNFKSIAFNEPSGNLIITEEVAVRQTAISFRAKFNLDAKWPLIGESVHPSQCKPMQNSFCYRFVPSNTFVLSVNSALLQCHANIVCYISENKVNHLLLPDKGIHYLFPQRTKKWYSQMCLWYGCAPKRRSLQWCANKDETDFQTHE